MSAPTLSVLSPANAYAQVAPFTLTLTGTGFNGSVVAYWGSTALATTYVSSTSATAIVTAPLIFAGVYQITVAVAGLVSNALTFFVPSSIAFPVPSAIDLVTVGDVKSWSEVQTANDDGLIQLAVTGFSAFVLRQTGYGPSDGSQPNSSPFVAPQPFNEWYDGNNNRRLFLNNYPVQSVTALSISGLVINQSTVFGQAGWVIDEGKKSISLRSGGGGGSAPVTTNFWVSTGGYNFVKDPFNPMNINVQYLAGFLMVPADLVEMAVRVCAVNYKRHQWMDLASKAITASGGSGTTSYRSWGMTPLDDLVLRSYKRTTY